MNKIKVVFEIPCYNSPAVEYLIHIAEHCISKEIGFVLFLSGYRFEKFRPYEKANLTVKYGEVKVTQPEVSMCELRASANKLNSEKFDAKFRIIASPHFTFHRHWESFVINACLDMEKFTRVSDYECYLGMGTAIGSSGYKDAPFISPLPIFKSHTGIIYSKADIFDNMTFLPSGLEEHYICSMLYNSGAIPLRKMTSPIFVNENNMVYNINVIEANNAQIVRSMWKDPMWHYQPVSNYKVTLDDGRYFAPLPRNAANEMRIRRKQLQLDPAMHLYLR